MHVGRHQLLYQYHHKCNRSLAHAVRTATDLLLVVVTAADSILHDHASGVYFNIAWSSYSSCCIDCTLTIVQAWTVRLFVVLLRLQYSRSFPTSHHSGMNASSRSSGNSETRETCMVEHGSRVSYRPFTVMSGFGVKVPSERASCNRDPSHRKKR